MNKILLFSTISILIVIFYGCTPPGSTTEPTIDNPIIVGEPLDDESPDQFLPNKCITPPGISCMDIKVEANQIKLILRNTLGSDMEAVTASVRPCDIPATVVKLPNGAQETFTLTDCRNNDFAVNNRIIEDLDIIYTNSETQISNALIGELESKIE